MKSADDGAEVVPLPSLEDTARLAEKIAREGVGCIGLSGPLGAGKTTFVRAFCQALGGREAEVSSPTFVLCHEYSLPENGLLLHWDLYRLTTLPEELLEPVSPGTIQVIEWYEKFPELRPDIELALHFTLPERASGVRSVTILRDGGRG